jgi:UDP-glucose 4-epimerase
MLNNKTILITGASGFVGSWLADEAIKAGYKIIGIDIHGPLRPQIWSGFATASCETVDLEDLLQGITLDAVCHLAGGASVASSVSNPYGDFSSLLPGTARLSLFLARHQPRARFLLFSSAAVYGNPQTLPIYETTPVNPISPYGIHKAVAEMLLSHYSRIYGLDITIFRIFSVYGPGLRKQLIWDVGQKALTAAANGQDHISLFGTGKESRDFIYIKDLCRAVLTVIASTSFVSGVEIYNLASGTERTITDVASCLIDKLGVKIKLEFNGEVPKGDPVNWRADITRLEQLGYTSDYSLELAMEEIATWMKEIT